MITSKKNIDMLELCQVKTQGNISHYMDGTKRGPCKLLPTIFINYHFKKFRFFSSS